jgi:hypothetical protein
VDGDTAISVGTDHEAVAKVEPPLTTPFSPASSKQAHFSASTLK